MGEQKKTQEPDLNQLKKVRRENPVPHSDLFYAKKATVRWPFRQVAITIEAMGKLPYIIQLIC